MNMEALLLDPANAATRVEFGMAEAEIAQRAQRRASAEAFRAIDVTMREAVAHPEVFVDEQMLRGDATELAERAAVADLAVRLSLAESTVRAQGHVARTLSERLPRLWAWFLDGEVSTFPDFHWQQTVRVANTRRVPTPKGSPRRSLIQIPCSRRANSAPMPLMCRANPIRMGNLGFIWG